MSNPKKPQKKIPKNKRFSCRDSIVLYLNGERKEFKNTMEFTKETGISGAIVKDWINGYLLFPFKGWYIKELKNKDQELLLLQKKDIQI